MKKMIFLIFLLCSVTSQVVRAQDLDELDDLDDRPKRGGSKSGGSRSSSAPSKASPPSDFDFRGGYGVLRGDSVSGGEGFEASLPWSAGHLRNYEFRFSTNKVTVYKLKYTNQSILFKDIPSVDPVDVDAMKDYGSFSFAKKPFTESSWMWARSISFSRGLYFQSRRANRTQPKAVMTSGHSAGFLMALEQVAAVGAGFDLETHTDLEIPFLFREYYDRTGFFTYGFNLEVGQVITYSIVPWQQWSIGVNYKQSQVQFSGKGEQGVTNGSDVQRDLWFPIELRIRL